MLEGKIRAGMNLSISGPEYLWSDCIKNLSAIEMECWDVVPLPVVYLDSEPHRLPFDPGVGSVSTGVQ